MWCKAAVVTCGVLALSGLCWGQEATRFRVAGGETAVGQVAEIAVFIVEAPAGVKALEGVLTLDGVQGHIEGIQSQYGVQVVAQTPRTLRFRWFDLTDQVGRRARDVELLRVSVVPEEVGEIRVSLAVPFLATDTDVVSVATVKTEPLVVRAPAAAKANEPPRARDDSIKTTEGAAVTIAVIANDSDPDGGVEPTTVTVVSEPKSGSMVVRKDGTVVYTPNEGFVGTDTFTYTVQDDKRATSNIATVTVVVEAGSVPPLTEPKGVPTLRMGGGEWAVGGPGWVVLRFDPGAGGLRRLQFELTVTDPDLVNVTAIEWEGLGTGAWELVAEAPDRWRVRLADLFDQVQPGAKELRVRIRLDFQTVGSAELRVRSAQGLDDEGRPFTAPDLSIEVACVLGPLEPRWARPQDLDEDGTFEDLDGDGELTLRDALLVAFYYDRPPLSLVPALADFDGDGILSFADAQALAQLVVSRKGG
ncbi:MAG: Ig-like domain-containing protein [Candidatus Bipolaricaulota bacterium]